jgi:hypothetical protein
VVWETCLAIHGVIVRCLTPARPLQVFQAMVISTTASSSGAKTPSELVAGWTRQYLIDQEAVYHTLRFRAGPSQCPSGQSSKRGARSPFPLLPHFQADRQQVTTTDRAVNDKSNALLFIRKKSGGTTLARSQICRTRPHASPQWPPRLKKLTVQNHARSMRSSHTQHPLVYPMCQMQWQPSSRVGS